MKNVVFTIAKILTVMALVIAALWCVLPFALYFTGMKAGRYFPAFLGVLTLLLAIPAFLEYARQRKLEALFTCYAWLCATMVLSSVSWAGIPVMELSRFLSIGIFGTVFMLLTVALLVLYTRKTLISFAAAPRSDVLPRLRRLLTTPIRSLYLLSVILAILAAVYFVAGFNKDLSNYLFNRRHDAGMPYPPAGNAALSFLASTQSGTVVSGGTVGAGDSVVGPYSFQAEAVLREGMILNITNDSGSISVDARTSLDRCCALDGASRCLTLQKMQPDERRPIHYSGVFAAGTGDNSPISRVEVEEGWLNFGSMKEAFEWIDRDGNAPFHFVYDNRGLLAGWYRAALPGGQGALVRVQIWQLSIGGERPEMLFGSQDDKLRVGQRAVDSSRISPAMRQAEQERIKREQEAKARARTAPADGQTYCVDDQDEVHGEFVRIDTEKEGIDIAFKEHKRDQRAETLGLSVLESSLERLIREKGEINGRNRLSIRDRTRVHVAFDGEPYFVPDDIAEWVPKRKNIILKQQWFSYKDIEYLYLITGFDGKAFASKDGGVDDIMFRTEGLYAFVSNRQGTIISGEKIDILRIENGAVTVGVRDDGYEGSGGKVVSFDGSKATLICDWGFGL